MRPQVVVSPCLPFADAACEEVQDNSGVAYVHVVNVVQENIPLPARVGSGHIPDDPKLAMLAEAVAAIRSVMSVGKAHGMRKDACQLVSLSKHFCSE